MTTEADGFQTVLQEKSTEKIEVKPEENAEEPETTLRQKFRDVWEEYLFSSVIVGVPHYARANWWPIKAMWVIGILAGTAGGLYFFITTVILYAQYTVLNQITINKEYPTYFPAVTICNLNPFQPITSQAYIDNLLTLKNKTEFINVTNTDTLEQSQDSNNTIDILDQMLNNLKLWVATDLTLNGTARKNLGFDLDKDMLISCTFNGKVCNAKNFSFYQSYHYGNCYTFNGGYDANNSQTNFLQTSKSGSDYGLHMEIMVGNPNNDIRFVYKSGIHLMVHNQSFTPLLIGENGISLPTGFDSYVGINRQFYYKLPSPYSTCIDDLSKSSNDYMAKLFGYMTGLNVKVYSQSFCYNMCFQDQVIDKCGCADAEFPTIRSASYCTSDVQLACLKNFEIIFDASNLDTQCNNGCPPKCTTVDYDLSVTDSMYPNEYYTDLLKTKSDFLDNLDLNSGSGVSYLRESLVKISVSYDDLSYTLTQEVAYMTVEVLVGNLGGLLGVFLGVTLLSFVEFIHLAMDLIRVTYLHYMNRRNKNIVKPFL